MVEDLPGGIEPLTEALVLHVEEVEGTGKSWRGVGFFRAHRRTQTATVREIVPLATEDLDGVRVPVAEGDSGRIETLADGSISIPIFAEELVVTKRTVLKERLILRKTVAVEERVVEDVLRYERVELDADEAVAGLVDVSGSGPDD